MTSATARLRVLALLGCAFAATGCMGPTYGTGVSQGQQLFNDLDSAVTLGSSKPRVDYSPRAELVKPKTIGALPPPREASVDPNLPETPEARRGRLQAAAPQGDGPLPVGFMTAQKEGMDAETPAAASFRTRQEQDNSWLSPQDMAGQRVAAQKRENATRQGSADQRKYLSEPPLAYRQPSATAPVGDQGVDEEVKARRLKGDTTLGSKLKGLWPF